MDNHFFMYPLIPHYGCCVCTLRSLVCDIVRIKMEAYEVAKVRSQTPDEYLRAFLDAEIKALWPQGWMQTRYNAPNDQHHCCLLGYPGRNFTTAVNCLENMKNPVLHAFK